MRRATGSGSAWLASRFDFYPRSPCGERPSTMTITICTVSFLSTLSLRRATLPVSAFTDCAAYFYPRSPCGERRDQGANDQQEQQISIHALLAESTFRHCTTYLFLSTLSLRRATTYHFMPIIGTLHFYPRSPCGERPRNRSILIPRWPISIHALLAESDRANPR